MIFGVHLLAVREMNCIDMNNQQIQPGFHFVPGPDSCTLCVCDNGNPKWCKAVLCSPPQNCKSFRVGNSCCEFICLDETLAKDSDHDFNAELGLRMIAALITAILSLSLLFFLLHRLRKRKIMGRLDRELTEEERSLGSIGYIAGSLGYLPEHHFEESGAAYAALWKPSFYTRGEAPPPYEEALAAARAEAALARAPGPSLASQMAAHHRTIPVSLTMGGPLLENTSPLPMDPRLLFPHDSPTPSSTKNLEDIGGPSNSGGEEAQTTNSIDDEVPAPRVSGPGVHPPALGTIPEAGEKVMATSPQGSEAAAAAEESDDYRSECENCNMQQNPGYEEDLVTMTLHRRTGDTIDQHFYSRTSLTLPTHPRKQQQRCNNGLQSGVSSCARENWFSSMPESSSSEEEDEEE